MFLAKACPCCGASHGHSRWAVANSSIVRPLNCKQCGAAFYQSGLQELMLSTILIPSGLFFYVHWSLGIAAFAIETVSVMLYINRRKPLLAASSDAVAT